MADKVDSSTEHDPLREGGARYVGYASRLAQFARMAERVASVRHLAYASDVGEAFRPVVPRSLVNASYGIAVGYVAADVIYKTHEAHNAGASSDEVMRVAAHTTTFQLLASVFAPFVIIHTQARLLPPRARTVDVFRRLLRQTRLHTVGPTVAGLAIIPLLPYVDEPIEHAIDEAFEKYWPAEGAASHGFAAAGVKGGAPSPAATSSASGKSGKQKAE